MLKVGGRKTPAAAAAAAAEGTEEGSPDHKRYEAMAKWSRQLRSIHTVVLNKLV